MPALTSRRNPVRFALAAGGLATPRAAAVESRRSYYMGASSSPSLVLVLAAGTEIVVYVDSYSLKPSRMDRWIFADMVSRAGDTVKRDAERAEAAANAAQEGGKGFDSPKFLRGMADACKARAALHGAPVNFGDYDRVQVTVTGEGDVYGAAKAWGVVSGWDGGQTVTVETAREYLPRLAEAGLTLGPVTVLRACPTEP